MAGPFYFAWVEEDETEFSASEHMREDEQVLSIRIDHQEGEFPTLEALIINPRVGFLAPGRKTWAWLSYELPPQDSESESEIVPLFFGRLVGIPDEIDDEQVRVTFVARPSDFDEQKHEVAESLKVAPFWDSIWFSPDTLDNPDNVLESRPELWHIDRVTHEVTTSNIIAGEDGVLTFDEDEVFYDSVRVTFGSPPARSVFLTASVSWQQQAAGVVDISSMLGFGDQHAVLTYTGKSLQESWPKSGARIGAGWSVHYGAAERVDGVAIAEWGYAGRNGIKEGFTTFSPMEHYHALIVPEDEDATSTTLTQPGGTAVTAEFPAHMMRLPRWRLIPTLQVRYDANRQRGETLMFVLESDVQAIVTEPGDEERIEIAMSSSEVASPVDPGGALPIGDVRSAVYFSTPRGTQSLEYLLMVARAQLLTRARAVFVDFEVPFDRGVRAALSCRKSAVLFDSRLPGGQAAGKIIGYSLSLDAESGAAFCAVSMGCTIGKGSTVTGEDGEPTYVEEGYVEPGYQVYAGQYVMPVPGEIAYESIEGQLPDDDGIDFAKMTPWRCVVGVTKTGSYTEQEAAMGDRAPDPGTVFERLNTVPTEFTVEMVPIGRGPFEKVYAPGVSMLMVPKTIDLEAEALSP